MLITALSPGSDSCSVHWTQCRYIEPVTVKYINKIHVCVTRQPIATDYLITTVVEVCWGLASVVVVGLEFIVQPWFLSTTCIHKDVRHKDHTMLPSCQGCKLKYMCGQFPPVGSNCEFTTQLPTLAQQLALHSSWVVLMCVHVLRLCCAQPHSDDSHLHATDPCSACAFTQARVIHSSSFIIFEPDCLHTCAYLTTVCAWTG